MQSSFEPKSLREKLIEVTQRYIEKKIKEEIEEEEREKQKREELKQSAQTSMFGFLKEGKERAKMGIKKVKKAVLPDGKECAKHYRDKVIRVAHNDDDLVNMILDDLGANKLISNFGTSKIYRDQMLQGLFEYLDIPFEEIEKEKYFQKLQFHILMKSWAANYSHGAAPVAPDTSTKAIASQLIIKKLNDTRPEKTVGGFRRQPGLQKKSLADQEGLEKHKQHKTRALGRGIHQL
ncbi:MAG: hypothetical protein A3F12_05350 [Gammaproteobacteria bacterium RIFCSPHIGHO2_12_FULL_38_14]|nr:MAG: hypothetical protein A3F12_05350 [Gammaproteobacteria bacterium RIFCSPHIGHO2_12_FULL_38_14]